MSSAVSPSSGARIDTDQASSTSRPARLDALAGLRIFAAVAVYFSHVGPPAMAPEALRVGLTSGYYGVTFFFTLSGFVLAVNYFDALQRPTAGKLWSFAVARFARIYPLYLLVLLYVVATTRLSGAAVGPWFEHALALQAWDPDLGVAYAFNGPGWSIGVELFLYATFPALVLVVARFDRGVGSLLVVTAVVAATMTMIALLFDLAGLGDLGRGDPNSAHRWLYRSPLFRVGDFALGILSARLYLRLRYWSRSERLGGILIMVALVATAALATNSSLLFSAGSWDVGYAIPAFALLLGLALAPRHRVSRFLAIPVVVLLGESSYAFYLVHMPILGSLGASGWGVQFNPMTATIQVFHLGIVLALAVGLHQLVEIPARSWLRARLGNVPGDRTLRIGPRQGTRG